VVISTVTAGVAVPEIAKLDTLSVVGDIKIMM
jgi:hypothetical protein